MADHKRHPWYRTIRQSMESIIQYVEYKEVKFKLISQELMEPEDIEEYDKLESKDAVTKITTKVLRSIPDCEKFVKVLKEMPRPRYKILTDLIDRKYEENNTTTQDSSTTPQRNLVVTIQRRLPESSCEEDAQSTVVAEESFAQVLMKSTKMFRKAIEDNKIRLKKSVGQPIIHKLSKYYMDLTNAHHTICSTEKGTRMFKNAVATVILHAQEILLVIKNTLTIKWPRLSESAGDVELSTS